MQVKTLWTVWYYVSLMDYFEYLAEPHIHKKIVGVLIGI